MALAFYDSTGDTSSTTGTGTLTLAGVAAPHGFLTVVSRAANGDTLHCRIVDSTDDTIWELSSCTYTTIGTTLSRDTVTINSSGTTAKVNFTHATNIYVCEFAQDITHDPLGSRTATVNQPIPTGIVDWATNGTNYVLVAGNNRLITTTDPTDASKWVGHVSGVGGNSANSVCRLSGVGYVVVGSVASIPQVWINANEDGVSWVNQTVLLPFIPRCIRTDGSTLVICGDSSVSASGAAAAGNIWTSPDGVTWTQQTSNAGANNLNWMEYNATFAAMIAVGAAGKIITAPAPFTAWTSRTSNTANALNRVVITPAGGTAVAVGASGTIVSTTAPGTAWTVQTSGTTTALTGIATDGTNYVASATNALNLYSSNLTTWSRFAFGTTALAFGNAKYVVATPSGILQGAALNALTPRYDAKVDIAWKSLAYNPGVGTPFWAVGGTAGDLVTSTDDGVTWTSQTWGGGANSINGVVYSTADLALIAVGAGGKVSKGTAAGTWASLTVTGSPANTYQAVCTDQSVANKLLAVATNGAIITTTNVGVSWTVQTSNVTDSLNSCASNGAGTYIAVGSNSRIGLSTDGGATWVWQNSVSNGIGTAGLTFNSVVWDGTRFVILSSSGLVFSASGAFTSWTLASSCGLTTATSLYYGNSEYSVCESSSNGHLLSSSDRVAWSIQRTGTGNASGSFIASYLNSKWFLFNTGGYFYAANALAWSNFSLIAISAASAYAGHLVAANNSGVVITSTDGVTFNLIANQLPASVIGIATDGTNFVAVTASAIYRSTDNGTTWVQKASRTVAAAFVGTPAVAFGNSVFVVTGNLGLTYTSPDGVTWTNQTRSAHNFQSICYDASLVLFVGLCSNGIILTGSNGSAWTVRETLLTAGSPIGATARICTNGAGGLMVVDGTASALSVYVSSDGITWKQSGSPATSPNASNIACLNGAYFILGSSVSPLSYSTDKLTWYNRQISAATSNTNTGVYFNSKYLFFGSTGNIVTWS